MSSIKRGTLILFSIVLMIPAGMPIRGRGGSREGVAPGLSGDVERQLHTIERMAARTRRGDRPDPRLFGALVRLEEMLPRSAETKRLQEQGRRLYIQTLSKHSLRAAARWEKTRRNLQRRIEQDAQYVRALKAIDGRLEAAAPAPQLQASACKIQRSLPLDEMRPGDIMLWDDRSGRPFIRFAVSIFAWKATHSAIYLGAHPSGHGPDIRLTYEALNIDRGVRVSLMDQKWMRHGLHVSLGHVKGFTPGAAERIVRSAVQQFGSDGRTPYHIWPPWDKTVYGGGLYCSQLVWRIYNQSGTDLDSNDWRFLTWFSLHNWYDPYAPATAYFGVFPDEIKSSPHITWYYDQVNP